ncbi:MAG: glycosyltransferase family 39 protein [Chthoniobacterales bacterium]
MKVSAMSGNGRRDAWIDLAWLLLCFAASAWWCVTAARALSATFDEPLYLQLGLQHWHTGALKPLTRLGILPLPTDVQALPLVLWEKWRGLTIDPDRDIVWALPALRAGTLVFWGALLIYSGRTGRALAGPWAGRLAVALIACEPVFLAHATLCTSDLAVTACLLAFFFEFAAHRERRWPGRLALPAVLFGAALLTKASALVFGGIGMVAIELVRWRSIAPPRVWRKWTLCFLRDTAIIGFGGLAVLLIYCGSDWKTEPTFIVWAKTLAPGFWHDTMLWLAEHLRIFSNGGEGLVQQIKHNFRGHGAYLLGREYPRAIWYYFPVALTIKTSLLLLALPIVVLVTRGRALWNWALLIALGLLLFSLNSRVQIGVRFMLPLLSCLAVGVAAATIEAGRSLTAPIGRWILIAVVLAGIVGNVFADVRVWPEALCFTNAAWGGTATGYLRLSDSNYDWGQGLLELEDWRQQHGIPEIDLWYFGTDPRASTTPFRRLLLNSNEWLHGRSPAEIGRGRCLAVSTTLLFGAYAKGTPAGRAAVAFFLAQNPTARTTTFFIYDFRGENLQASQQSAAAP